MKMLKNLKARFKNYGFWMSLVSALGLVAKALEPVLGYHLPLDFDTSLSTVVTSVLGVLVLLGIVSNPTVGSFYADAPVEEEKK
jgi:phi LC3 family holin